MAHLTGQSRDQLVLFAKRLDEAVGKENPVRVMDCFVERLDLAELGFSNVVAEEMGRPSYAPGDMLKLYVYGYMNRVRSSRGLEREAGRNVEVMWLIGGFDAGVQDHCGFPQGSSAGDCGGLPQVHPMVPGAV